MNKITIKNNVKIINDKYVIKKNNNINKDIYSYLNNRNFYNIETLISSDDKENKFEYIKEIKVNKEQKINDLILLDSVLHNKTEYYKELDLIEIKSIYENYIDNLNKLLMFYQDINEVIDKEIYMSPSNYLLVRNISSIYNIINNGNIYINKWYDSIKNKKNIRYVLNHNNLVLDHILESSDNKYLISFNKSDFNYNSYDLYNIFKNNFNIIEIDRLLELYTSKIKLNDYEYYLFIALLCNIDMIKYIDRESNKIKDITYLIEYINKVNNYILNNNSDKEKK